MALTIRCPHCQQESVLLHTRPVWIIGVVVAIPESDSAYSPVTEDDDESYMEDGPSPDYYSCGSCMEELDRDVVLNQVFPNAVVQREA